MEEVKNKLLMSLQKVGINKIGSFEYFFSYRPDVAYSDGRTIFFEDGKYHVLNTDRGKLIQEEVFGTKDTLNYYLLDTYIVSKASEIVAKEIGNSYHLYQDKFFEKQIALFDEVSPLYGKWKQEELKRLMSENSIK
ncbi:TPA: hypothetical protein TXL52_001212 [Streptococcus suis]|nr:hypothetical protein [Streptococcus suis]